jgi:hypothetical protein
LIPKQGRANYPRDPGREPPELETGKEAEKLKQRLLKKGNYSGLIA